LAKTSSPPLISVIEAEKIILNETRNYGVEQISIENALGRILASPLIADRDFPPFNRVTMDGIALKYGNFQKGQRKFHIQSTQAAGEPQQSLVLDNECIEVMTGAILPMNTDTVIRYEDLEIEAGYAKISSEIKAQQNVHFLGEDRKNGDIIVSENTIFRPAEIAIAASVGTAILKVKKLPKVAIITSGDELVAIDKTPELHQIRSSNVYAIASILAKYGIVTQKYHIQDSLEVTIDTIHRLFQDFDVLVISGGVSMGKKDFTPQALEKLGVEKLFHKIAQTPGKPIWFGKKGEKLVFALPGNPVSTYMCMVRYFQPWLFKSLKMNNIEPEYAMLSEDFEFNKLLTYFLQVKLKNEEAFLKAYPIKGHGSGDFANMVDADAFLELPSYDHNDFKKGEVFRIWRF
jgi:molybdopterin molybdotransferase